jgi:hypothetical protein
VRRGKPHTPSVDVRTPPARHTRATSAGAAGCRTLRHNTHSTRAGDETVVVYAWHPWAGRSVCIHDVIERATGAAARCSLAGVAAARVQELPVWMLDTAACRPVRLTQEPMVTLATFVTLRGLLSAAMQPLAARDSFDARLASPEPHRGDRHATPTGTPVSPPSAASLSTRSLSGKRTTGSNSASVEHAARSDTADADRLGHPTADRARQRRGSRGKRLVGELQR